MKRDARSLPQAAQEELRRTAMRLVGRGVRKARRRGSWGCIARRSTGGSRPIARAAIGRLARVAVVVGADTPSSAPLSRRRSRGSSWATTRISSRCRGSCGRGLVCDLIRQQFGIEVGEDTAGRYLRAWGFSPQKPMRRAYERSDEAVRRWLEERYPEIERRARRERAEILWADESGLRCDHTAGRTWAPIGQTPVTKGTGKRFKANMIAAVSNTGTLRFRVFDERFTGPVFLDFLRRLVKDAAGRKVVLIVDGHPAHRARLVRDWVAAHPGEIALHFLPGYAPELNPAEMLNQDVKTNALGRRRPVNVTALKADVRRFLRSCQRRPAKVARYFQERHVIYAAATAI